MFLSELLILGQEIHNLQSINECHKLTAKLYDYTRVVKAIL